MDDKYVNITLLYEAGKFVTTRTDNGGIRVMGIDELPLEDVRPVVRGRWKPVTCREMFGGSEEAWYGHGDPIACHLCSNCNGYPWFDDEGNEALTDFCPNCGADLRE